MSVLRLPVDGVDANYDISFDLDGAEYQFQLRFNDRDQAWYFNLLDVSGTLLRAGVKLVPNFPLLRQIADARRPAGEVILVDTRGDLVRGPPLQTQLGDVVFLTYVELATILEQDV